MIVGLEPGLVVLRRKRGSFIVMQDNMAFFWAVSQFLTDIHSIDRTINTMKFLMAFVQHLEPAPQILASSSPLANLSILHLHSLTYSLIPNFPSPLPGSPKNNHE
jgi:hypothetical protein